MSNVSKYFRRLLALAIVCCLVAAVCPLNAGAEDISGHWAANDINFLREKGIVQGDDQGNINPNNNITRAEFVAIINRAFEFTETGESNFPDVESSAWYCDDFAIAKNEGYILGDNLGNANPGTPIIRAEVAVICARVLELEAEAESSAFFDDSASFPDWSDSSIIAMVENKLIEGYPGNTFRALNNITRAEAFTILARIIRMLEAESGIIEDEGTPLAEPESSGGTGGGGGGGGGGGNGGGGNGNGGDGNDGDAITLESIAITAPPVKLSYLVGQGLDLAGLVVTGTYSDGSTKPETVTMSNISGFNSSAPAAAQTVTVTVGGKTATFVVAITSGNGGGNEDPAVSAGQRVVVTVTADALANVCNYQFQINYDKGKLEFKKDLLSSKIPSISLFFTSKEGYELIGGLNSSQLVGVSGQNIDVCEISFTAKEDMKLADIGVTISEIYVVSPTDVTDFRQVTGWTLKITV